MLRLVGPGTSPWVRPGQLMVARLELIENLVKDLGRKGFHLVRMPTHRTPGGVGGGAELAANVWQSIVGGGGYKQEEPLEGISRRVVAKGWRQFHKKRRADKE